MVAKQLASLIQTYLADRAQLQAPLDTRMRVGNAAVHHAHLHTV